MNLRGLQQLRLICVNQCREKVHIFSDGVPNQPDLVLMMLYHVLSFHMHDGTCQVYTGNWWFEK